MLLPFWIAIFLGSALLFLVQPMFAKLVLPLLGGSPATWNLLMAFFQAGLLVGYAYAHGLARLSRGWQVAIHTVMLALPVLSLPIAVPESWQSSPPTEGPSGWLLSLALVAVGAPFVAVSATAPLLQRWYSGIGDRWSQDPYFLYAGSNLGSMLGLFGYPFLVEPYFALASQGWLWSIGYGLLTLAFLRCMHLFVAKGRSSEESVAGETGPASEPVTILRRAQWVLLAFVPSLLMLGVTTHLTTDIASFPLLWILPLSLYLLSFVWAFGYSRRIPFRAIVIVVPWLVLGIAISSFAGVIFLALLPYHWSVVVPLHLVTFFLVSLVCHGELARDRPAPEQLTDFYWWIAVGGVLGGSFNALVAPMSFSTVAEYPLGLLLALLVFPRADSASESRTALFVGVLAVVGGFALFDAVMGVENESRLLLWALALSAPGAMSLAAFGWSPRYGVLVGAMLAPILVPAAEDSRDEVKTIVRQRNFFGVKAVIDHRKADEHSRELSHGTTRHGVQLLLFPCTPQLYYEASGPLGDIFATFSGPDAKDRVAVIGLGTGGMICYGKAGQNFTFYEIDPQVASIAQEHFTYLDGCGNAERSVVLGDGRMRLAEEPDGRFDMIVIDAFTSDAIPIHLLTMEAVELYFSKLAPNGVVLFHVSNRYLDLEPVLASIARQSGRAFRATWSENAAGRPEGVAGSRWQYVLLAREASDLKGLANDPNWRGAETFRSERAWTDDFSDVVGVVHWWGIR